MGKVSIGLRGWRFDEEEVFDENGDLRPLETMEESTRNRLIRLRVLAGKPCDCCYLLSTSAADCNEARVVYGEPLAEVLLCQVHEPEFLYWYREDGGKQKAGTDHFADMFHEWFAAENRAPPEYNGVAHVDTDPETLPTFADTEGTCGNDVDAAIAELSSDERAALNTDYSDVM